MAKFRRGGPAYALNPQGIQGKNLFEFFANISHLFLQPERAESVFHIFQAVCRRRAKELFNTKKEVLQFALFYS